MEVMRWAKNMSTLAESLAKTFCACTSMRWVTAN